jgi:hypothetical protein
MIIEILKRLSMFVVCCTSKRTETTQSELKVGTFEAISPVSSFALNTYIPV